jgi:hypothetical protein
MKEGRAYLDGVAILAQVYDDFTKGAATLATNIEKSA